MQKPHPMTTNQLIARSLAATAAIAMTVATTSAGPLTNAYEQFKNNHPGLQAQDYILKAAEQDVITEKRGYMPTVFVEAKQLAVGQDINQSGPGVYQEGSDNYGNQRAKLEIDQPLIDLSVKHKVAEAEAKRRLQSGMLQTKEGEVTQHFVQTFTNAMRFAQLVASLDRVVTRLDRELANISKSFEKQMATVEDVENIKSALVAMRQEKLLFEQEHDRCLAELGLTREATAGLSVPDSKHLKLPVPVGTVPMHSPEANVLQAEIDAYQSKIAATHGEDMPRLSLYGLVQRDDAGGSEFGGPRTLNGYEAGLVLRWNVWDGGMNRSEAKKLEFLRLAKEAELKAQRARASRDNDLASHGLKLSQSNLESLDKLVEHQATILKAIETSYKEGGETSYINMVNAYLIYESQIRQQAHGRFDYINKQAELYALHTGWTSGLIQDLDRMFTRAN